MKSFKLVLALCLLPSFTTAADDDVFPVIDWVQLMRTPFSASTGSAAPSCVDFDGDGTFDCFVGSAGGDIEYYVNTGTSSAYVYARDSSKDITGQQAYSKPSVGDFDGDGDYDFYIGGYDGKVAMLTNNGDGTYTEENDDIFASAIKKYNSGSSGSLVKGTRSAASVAIPLAVTGLASVGVGTLGSMLMMLPSTHAASSSLGTYSAPTCLDIDNDGDLDCLIGYYDGSCSLFINTGTSTEASFKLTVNDLFKGNYDDDARMASPFLKDFDGDGDYDVVVGFDSGAVYYYENTAAVNQTSFSRSDFSKLSDDLFSSSSSVDGNAAPWCGQVDGDSKIECFVGSENGTTYTYDSEAPAPTPAPAVSMHPSASPTMAPFTMPTITKAPTTSDNQVPTGNNNNKSNDNLSMGSIGWLVAVIVSVVFVVGAGVAFFINRKSSTGRDAFDDMAAGGNAGNKTDSLALFNEPHKHNSSDRTSAGGGGGQAPGILMVSTGDVQMVTPPTPPAQQMVVPPPAPVPAGPPPLAVAVRAQEYDDEGDEVRVFGATAVKGDSARFAVAQSVQQEEEYRSVTEEKYAQKMAENAPKGGGGGMYTANMGNAEVTAKQQSFQQDRLSSIDTMVSPPVAVTSLDDMVKDA
jgi:hypothetical protein